MLLDFKRRVYLFLVFLFKLFVFLRSKFRKIFAELFRVKSKDLSVQTDSPSVQNAQEDSTMIGGGQEKIYSQLKTPNAQMAENDVPCKADFYSAKANLANESNKKCSLQIKVESKRVLLEWKFPPFARKHTYKLVLFRYNGKDNYTVSTSIYTRKCTKELYVGPGVRYAVLVTRLPDNKIAMEEFKAVFSQAEIDRLYQKAKKFARKDGFYTFNRFYRCKPKAYFDELQNNKMQPYIKDQGGHLESPINGELRGLFFSTKTSGGNRPFWSHFGDTCLSLDANKIFDPNTNNAYFADFFCIWNGKDFKQHYITVVFCKKDSNADEFCKAHLKLLDTYTNPFMRAERCVSKTGVNYLKFHVAQGTRVDAFFTEAVEFDKNDLYSVEAKGAGTSSKSGVKSRRDCDICNFPSSLQAKLMEKIGNNLKSTLAKTANKNDQKKGKSN